MKLEDIKKKNIYTVPDKYFDQLPTRIQSRVNEKHPVSWLSWNWSLTYKLAAPAIAIILIVIYFGRTDNYSYQDTDAILAQVSTEDIIAYLEFTDITTDDIIENVDFTDIELDFYEDGPIIQEFNEMDEEDMELLLDEYGLEDEIL